MVTFLMTFTTPNPVFKVTAFLKSNIVSDSWVSYQYRRSTTKLEQIRHYPSWLSFCDVLKSCVLFFLKWIPVENNEWIQQVTQVNRNRATNSSVCVRRLAFWSSVHANRWRCPHCVKRIRTLFISNDQTPQYKCSL